MDRRWLFGTSAKNTPPSVAILAQVLIILAQGAVNHVNERVEGLESQVASSSAATMEATSAVTTCESKMQQLQTSLQQLSANIATKADFTGTLQQAMEHQSKELRLLLAKRSPDATPTNESKLPRNC